MSTQQVFHFIKHADVKDVFKWQNMRKDILDFFSRNVYGVNIFASLKTVKYTLISTAFEEQNITMDKVSIKIADKENGDKSIDLALYVYRDINSKDEKKPILIMLQHLTDFNYGKIPCEDINDGNSTIAINTYIKSGINVAVLDLNSIAANDNNGCGTGVFTLAIPREPQDAKIIGAWAWGVSRAVDYLYGQNYTDTSKIALTGHSRGGKAALWAAANDERIKAVMSNNSGCTGASMAYNNTGEKIVNINTAFPQWFCDNYKKYNDMQNSLSFDQHMLLSAIAPRFLYVASSDEDFWADPKNELWAARLAGEAYELFGVKPLIAPENDNIELDKGYHEGHIAYHRKKGKHSVSYKDWLLFLQFFRAKNWI